MALINSVHKTSFLIQIKSFACLRICTSWFFSPVPLSYYHSVSDVTEPEPSGGNPGGGSLYTFGEADGGKLGLGKNVTSEADVPTRVDIPDESVSGNFSLLIRLYLSEVPG